MADIYMSLAKNKDNIIPLRIGKKWKLKVHMLSKLRHYLSYIHILHFH